MPTLGTCPVCERAIRVRGGKMVHHGYARPGRGHIVGDCFAVNRAPYEVSCDATRDYHRLLAGRRDVAADFLRRLEAGDVARLYHDEHVPVPTTLGRGGTLRRDPGWTTRQAAVYRNEADPESQHRWRTAWTRARQETVAELRWLDAELARARALVDRWVPGELKEIAGDRECGPVRRHRRRLCLRRA
jgi:hypothetical protein